MKKLRFVKVKCQCGYTNLIPAYENIRCEKCGKIIAEPKELTRLCMRRKTMIKPKDEEQTQLNKVN